MKKLFIVLTAVIGLLTINAKAVELPPKTDHEKVKVYLFYADWCPHCHDFIEYFLKNYKEDYKDYFEIVTFLSGTDATNVPTYIQANSLFASTMSEYFSIDSSQFGWPFIIVGDYYTLGFSDATGQEIIEEALRQYQNETYKDVVEELRQDTTDVKDGSLEDAANASGIRVPKQSTALDGVYVAIIFIVIIGGIGGLVFFARRQEK